MFKASRKRLIERLKTQLEIAERQGDHPIANILRHAVKDVEDWL